MHILNVMSSFKTVPVTLERFSPGKHCETKTSLDMFLKMKILEEQRLSSVLRKRKCPVFTLATLVSNSKVCAYTNVIFSFPALWLCEKENVWASPSRSTWPSTSARVPYAPFVKSPPISLASRPLPPSPSHSRPIRWRRPQRSALAVQVKLQGPWEEEGGAVAFCRHSYRERQGEGAPCQPWAAWTPPLRSTAVTAMITVSHLEVSLKQPNKIKSAHIWFTADHFTAWNIERTLHSSKWRSNTAPCVISTCAGHMCQSENTVSLHSLQKDSNFIVRKKKKKQLSLSNYLRIYQSLLIWLFKATVPRWIQ